MTSPENLGRQFPVYSGPGLADKVGGWSKYALTERPADEINASPVARKYNAYTAMVPTHSLVKYMEYDRTGRHDRGDSEAKINSIAEDLRKGGPTAMREPLWLSYDHESKWGYLSEGHHRLEAALRAGVSHVPLMISGRGPSHSDRVKESYKDGMKVKNTGAPLHLDTRLVENRTGEEGRDGYYPSQLHPGNFQEFEGSR